MFYLVRFWRFLTLANEGGFVARWKTLRWHSRGLILLSVVYAFTPPAVLNDWIPIIGQLDELVVYSTMLALALKLSPLPKNRAGGTDEILVQHVQSSPKESAPFRGDARASHNEG
jgi:uncharacterized membrane protein YkvA (DUF1232 family)